MLRDNLHGLEIDERCCQIAAFALAFAAWTYPDAGGYRPLPDLHIACTGIGPQATEEQWVKLAEQSGMPMPAVGREAIKNGLLNLHRLFSQAPTLGSLINPAELPADLIAADYETIQPYLAAILKAEKADDETRERAIAAAGMVKAADLLAGEYTLVITNVPYLGRGKQDELLKEHSARRITRRQSRPGHGLRLSGVWSSAAQDGTVAMVTPQNWLFLTTYRRAARNAACRRSMELRCATWARGVREHQRRGGQRRAAGHLRSRATATGHRLLGIDASASASRRRRRPRASEWRRCSCRSHRRANSRIQMHVITSVSEYAIETLLERVCRCSCRGSTRRLLHDSSSVLGDAVLVDGLGASRRARSMTTRSMVDASTCSSGRMGKADAGVRQSADGQHESSGSQGSAWGRRGCRQRK